MPSPASKANPRAGRRQTAAELREMQRLAFACIVHPLTPSGQTQSRFADGRLMRDIAGEFIKPNDRLTSLDRISIYNRQYWYRMLDCLWDDYPGLRAIMGMRKFEKLRIAYLRQYPSKSFTLRNLGSRLPEFVAQNPGLVGVHHAMCLDMSKFEWAQIVTFDSEAKKPLHVDDLLGENPDKLRLSLQPYLNLLEMEYPLDDFVIAVKKRDRALLRSEASNAVENEHVEKQPKRIALPKARKTYLAVHRHEFDLYYRRLAEKEFRILTALSTGQTLSEACEAAVDDPAEMTAELARQLRQWFEAWAKIGWLCRR